jgi:hypothetical protein
MLCRGIVWRQYAQFGEFRALANQPGVEFHLKLSAACHLGEPGRLWGWQCKWYDLASGTAIGATRRSQIADALSKAIAHLPGLTDWVLWTRHVLTKGDQKWFYGSTEKVKLHLWSAIDVESLVDGPAAILRGTYFGDLVLTPEKLCELHKQSVAPIRRRWVPEAHQVVDAQRALRSTLIEIKSWDVFPKIVAKLEEDLAAIGEPRTAGLAAEQEERLARLVAHAEAGMSTLSAVYELLKGGEYQIISQTDVQPLVPTQDEKQLVRRLRSTRNVLALTAANILSDLNQAVVALRELHNALQVNFIAVVADAGYGKTQLSAQLTAPTRDRSAGVFLRGKTLGAHEGLDEFARRVVINGRAIATFEELVAAVDAAGQRQGRRLPIFIDGLNEAEDPRQWKDQLAPLTVVLSRYPNTQVICTLRSAFVAEALPDDTDTLEINGFGDDLYAAIRRYFAYYLIDGSDAELPSHLLDHPLTLRIFCEVANPDRRRQVGVGAIPASLTLMFERYLEQVAERIFDLAPSDHRYYPSDIRTALQKIGTALWHGNSRDLEMSALRRLLADESRPWNKSIVAALEHEGILFREPGDRPGHQKMSLLYDALAGHIVADAVLSEYTGDAFDAWIRADKTISTLKVESGQSHQSHPLAYDIFRSLVELVPIRINRRQFWSFLDGRMRADALFYAAFLDGAYLDEETVDELAKLVVVPSLGYRDLFKRLFVTRGAQAHPLDALFLDRVLRPMSVIDRELRWSEWVRAHQSEMVSDLVSLERRWNDGKFKERDDRLRARWVMWTLTSTVRILRDRATYALYRYGCGEPEAFFALALESLAINDPYISERMLAACYGVAMSLWADPKGAHVRAALPRLARALLSEMFLPNAPHATFHALTVGYAFGVISIARKLDPSTVETDKQGYLIPPFSHLPSPFPPASDITDEDVAGAEAAIHMDFGNYTLGGLIRQRQNYDFDNATYKDVRRQIEYRIKKLGYAPDRVNAIDKSIASEGWRPDREKAKTDRYGKKFSWIAFFEMYGVLSGRGEIPEWRNEGRPPDADIDPSFPQEPKTWQPLLPDVFSRSSAKARIWIGRGPRPDYSDLLNPEEVDQDTGPWVLLEGFIDQLASTDKRNVFSFLRGVLVSPKKREGILRAFEQIEYPGNQAIPEPSSDIYTYAGEIPWAEQFGKHLRDESGKAKRDERSAFPVYGRKRSEGTPVEIPAFGFGWESYHCPLNQTRGTLVPAPAVCEALGLTNRQGEWDFYDAQGRCASLYREFKSSPEGHFTSRLLYLRADLMKEYLSTSNLSLVWMVWGERQFHYSEMDRLRGQLNDLWSEHKHIHKYSDVWKPR